MTQEEIQNELLHLKQHYATIDFPGIWEDGDDREKLVHAKGVMYGANRVLDRILELIEHDNIPF